METVSIFFSDLTEEKQRELLKLFGLISEREMNWEVIPIVIIDASPETIGQVQF